MRPRSLDHGRSRVLRPATYFCRLHVLHLDPDLAAAVRMVDDLDLGIDAQVAAGESPSRICMRISSAVSPWTSMWKTSWPRRSARVPCVVPSSGREGDVGALQEREAGLEVGDQRVAVEVLAPDRDAGGDGPVGLGHDVVPAIPRPRAGRRCRPAPRRAGPRSRARTCRDWRRRCSPACPSRRRTRSGRCRRRCPGRAGRHRPPRAGTRSCAS